MIMKLSKLCEKLNILEITANPDTEISGICYDSRKCSEGSLFVAIKGLSSDGNKFIPTAMEAGASAVICQSRPETDVPYVLVDDCRKALALLSCAFYSYPADQMKIIGVTGTSGKTTSTNLIKHILETVTGDKVGLVGTNGNMIGDEFIHTEFTTPESLELQELFRRMVDAGCKYAVMEVSSHSLIMERVAGIRFSTAAFTNLSQDHLDLHKTMDEYAAAKRLIFSVCDKACINLDDNYSDFMMSEIKCPLIRTSIENSDADIFAKDIRLSADSVEFTAVKENESADVMLAIPGLFSCHNALTAISVCVSEGLGLQDCAQALRSASGVKGRVETLETDGDYSIIIDYSHKPDPLEKVLQTLRGITRGRLICLFGCGGDRDHEKRPIMGRIAADNSDFVIVTSDNPRTEEPMDIINQIVVGLNDTKTPYDVICDRIEAIHYAIDMAKDGDVILLAGKGHEDYQVIGHTKIHMDEREIVADYLKERANKK